MIWLALALVTGYAVVRALDGHPLVLASGPEGASPPASSPPAPTAPAPTAPTPNAPPAVLPPPSPTPQGSGAPATDQLHLSLFIRVSPFERLVSDTTARSLSDKMRGVITRLVAEARTAGIGWPAVTRVRWLVTPVDQGFSVGVWWVLPPTVHPTASQLSEWGVWTHGRLRRSENGDRISAVRYQVIPILTGGS